MSLPEKDDKIILQSSDQPHPPQVLPSQPYIYTYQEEEVNLLDYWRVIRKRKWLVLATIFVTLALAVVLSFVLPKKYKGLVSLMPLTQTQRGGGGLSSLASQFSSMPLVGGSLGGLTESLSGGKSKEIMSILQSRTLAERTINRFNLMPVLFAKEWNPNTKTFGPNWLGRIPILEDGVSKFRKKVLDVDKDKKTNLIEVEVTMKDPVLAAKVANGMVVELQDFISNHSLTVAKRNRIFIEEQMVKNRVKLLEAGKELNKVYASSNISSVNPQINVEVGSYEPLPKSFEDFRQELEQLGAKQSEVEKRIEVAKVTGVPAQVYLEYLTLNRQILSEAHALLTQQYEMAKIDEAKEDLAFQVIDKAQVRQRPSWPKPLLNVVIGFMAGIFIGLFLAFFREYISKLKEKEAESAKA